MILASLFLLSGLADVTLTLPSEAKVRGTELELAQIVDVRCDDATTRERIGHFTLGWAPAPGYSRLVQRWQLARDVHAAFPGIAIEVAGAENCRVLPLTQHVEGGELAKTARAQLEALFQGRDAALRPSSMPADLEVPAAAATFELRAALDRRELRGGNWSVPVQVWIDGVLYQTSWVGFAVELWAEMPVLVRDLARGELCSPEMVETRRVKVEGDTPFAALDGLALAGAVAQRDLPRGSPVTDRDVRRAKLVAIGQPITLEIKKGAITARSTVTCRQDGSLGDTVKIVNADASREFAARVVGRALVRIRTLINDENPTMNKLIRASILAVIALALGAGVLFAQGPQSRAGSIYDPSAGPFGLVANKTAGRPGDLLTVEISENQDLKNEESADLKRETSLKAQLTNFDIKPNAFSVLPQLDGSSADALKGTANYAKKGKFTARVTAVVVDVLPNGNLVVNGRREIRIDQETKLIEFSGIVRRWDIHADNTIPSELVAEAKVSYTGKGPLTDQTTRRGIGSWLHDAFLWLWPF